MSPKNWIAPMLLAFAVGACDCGAGTGEEPPDGFGGAGGEPIVCDADGDGFEAILCGGDDCDDRRADVYPGAPESCNGIDDDCDGAVDEDCACAEGEYRPCYPLGLDHPTRGVGTCTDGLQRCVDGFWSGCEGAVVPEDEGDQCDGLDQDCDGIADGPLLNRCRECGEVPVEICGNGLDDDCDGIVDNPEQCRIHCGGVDPEAPAGERTCCVRDPDAGELVPEPVQYSRLCVEWDGLPACTDEARRCLDLDGNPDTPCVKTCLEEAGGTRCLCGVDRGEREPVADPGCGFETPCNYRGCEDRKNQPCYSGPPGTLGVGACRGGRHDCVVDESGVRRWAECVGEVLPSPEICGNGIDDDCDGEIDEADGLTGRRCVLAGCAEGTPEVCGNGLDDDCDGLVDEGCPADGATQPCYRGPPATRGVGPCTDGVQEAVGGRWGPCEGDVLPAPEVCGDGVDSDCNGLGGPGAPEDPGCCVATSEEEICGNGRDDDCDGLVDGGVVDACGACGAGACEEALFEVPSDCRPERDRRCVNIQPATGDVEAITLAWDKRVFGRKHVLYFFSWDLGTLVQLDAETGEILWRVPLLAKTPTDLVVDVDGTAWVGHRGWELEGGEERWGPLVHYDRNGNVLCKLDLRDGVEGIAPDDEGNVWVANGFALSGLTRPDRERHHVYKVHGSRVRPAQPDGRPWPDGIPRCDVVDLVDGPEEALDVVYALGALRMDHRGRLWGSVGLHRDDHSEEKWVVQIDTATLAVELIPASHPGPKHPPCFDPAGNAWFASASPYHPYRGLYRFPADGPYDPPPEGDWPWEPFGHQLFLGIPHGVGFEDFEVASVLCTESEIWVEAGRFYRVDLATLSSSRVGDFFKGAALTDDLAGRIWLVGRRGDEERRLHRYDPATDTWDSFQLPGGLELWSVHSTDVAGAAVLRRAAGVGRFEQRFDAGWAAVDWKWLDWSELEPLGSSVRAVVRFAALRSELETTPVVCAFDDPPADLDTCPGADGKRFVSVEVELRAGTDGRGPTVRDIRIAWTRP